MIAAAWALAALSLLPTPSGADEPTAAAQLAEGLGRQVGMEFRPCSDALDTRDRSAVCGAAPYGLKGFKTRFEEALKQPAFSRFRFIPVVDWEKQPSGAVRASYWIGAASVEAVFDKKRSESAILVSRPYPRCGDDIPFAPIPVSAHGAEAKAATPVYLAPESYPRRDHDEKIDGTAALAVSVTGGEPTVVCVHHASPSGHGFELPAIEAVRSWTGDLLVLENAEDGSTLTVLVEFSRASARRKPVAVDYH